MTPPGNCMVAHGCTGRRRLAAHNERRHPAELVRSCGSMPRWGIDRCATPQRRPLQINRKVAIKASPLGGVKTPPYSTNRQGSVGANSVRPCNLAAAQDSAGEQCSPLQPPQSLPCVKGNSPQCGEMSRSDRGARCISGCPAGAEGLERVWACWVVPVRPQSLSLRYRAASSLYTREPSSTPIEFILAPEGSICRAAEKR